jgi:hypothetical protein
MHKNRTGCGAWERDDEKSSASLCLSGNLLACKEFRHLGLVAAWGGFPALVQGKREFLLAIFSSTTVGMFYRQPVSGGK